MQADEIKYRVWDPDMESMSPVCTLLEWFVSYYTHGSEHKYATETMESYISKLVHMRFTGVRDKKNVQIFESDILRLDRRSFIVRLGGQYIWDYDLNRRNYTIGFCLESIGESDEQYKYWHMDSYGEMQIIGNIYENPELLK